MAAIDENMRTFLLAQSSVHSAVNERVHQNHVPQEGPPDPPYIYYAITGTADDAAIDDSAGGPTRYFFGVECWGTTVKESRDLATNVQAALNKHRGTFGDTTVKGVFAADAADDYEPRGHSGDEGLHVSALAVEVVT